MLEQGEGEVALFIQQVICFCWLREGEGEHPAGITGLMARRVLMEQEAWEEIYQNAEKGELTDIQVSAIVLVAITMGELARVGWHRGVLG